MKTRRKKKKVKEAARWKSIPWRDVDNPVPCQNTLRFFCLPSSPVPTPCTPLSILAGSLLLLLLPSLFSLPLLLFYSSPLSLIYRGSRIIYNVSPFWKRDFRLSRISLACPGTNVKILQIGNREPVVPRFYQIVIPWKYRVAVPQFAGNTSFNVYGLPELFPRNIEIKGGRESGFDSCRIFKRANVPWNFIACLKIFCGESRNAEYIIPSDRKDK